MEGITLGQDTPFDTSVCNFFMGPLVFLVFCIKGWSNLIYGSSSTWPHKKNHYNDVIMGAMASQITSLTIVYSTVYSDADQENIKAPCHRPLCGEFTGDRLNSPHKWPVTRKKFPFDDVSWLFNVINYVCRTHDNLIIRIGIIWVMRILLVEIKMFQYCEEKSIFILLR